MKVLITGGAGYLGSNLVYELSNEGHECLVYDDFSTGCKHVIEEFNFIEADIRDKNALGKCIKDFQPETVIHLAALATVGDCENDPDLCHEVNIGGTENICEAMLENGVKNIIFASSAAVYNPSKEPLTEKSSVGPVGVYGHSKLDGEKIIKKYQDKGLNSVVFRMFNLAGAQEQGKFGELHEPETHIIPLTIDAAFSGKEIKVFGDDYNTDDGSAVRDYIHVTDAAQAFVKACDYIAKNSESETFNLGSGNGMSVLEIINKISDITGREVSRKIEGRRQGDEAILISDNSKAQDVLGWALNLSDINNVVLTASRWHVANAK